MRWMRWIGLALVGLLGAGWWVAAGRDTGPGGGAAARDLARIRAAMDAGRFMEASRLLDALNPTGLATVEDRRAYALMAMEVRRPDAAVRATEKDARGTPRDTEEARLLHAEALLRAGRVDAAKTALAELEVARLKGDRWHYLFALLSQLRGEPHIAREHLDPVIARGARDAQMHVNWAQLAPDGLEQGERRLMAALGAADDPARIRAALGRLLLARQQPRRALDPLESAIRERPWDRDARVDLARACLLVPGLKEAARGVEVARAVVAEAPDDTEARTVLAGCLASLALQDSRRKVILMEEAIREYTEVLRRPLEDPRTRMMLLLGLARAHVELIGPFASDADIRRHFAEAQAALDTAEPLDREPGFTDAWGVRLLAEVHFLRAKSLRRAHIRDDRDCVELYEKAWKTDRKHMEAAWDVGLLYYDFLRDFQYLRRASAMFDEHIAERKRRGLPPLDDDGMAIVDHTRRMVADRRGRAADETTPRRDPAAPPEPPKRPDLPDSPPPPEAPR